MQLRKLRYCPAGTQAKIRVINGKVYAGALYGVEAARIVPAKLARLSAAIIDAFRVKNDNHNADRFFTTITKAKDELDPVVQVLSTRVMQVRRTSCKQEGATENFKATLLKHATKHKQGKRWPTWFFTWRMVRRPKTLLILARNLTPPQGSMTRIGIRS